MKSKKNKRRNVSCSWIGIFNIVKVFVLPSLIYRFNAISIKISATDFMNIDKLILRFISRGKRPINTLKENKVGRLTLPDPNTYYKATVIKTVQYG